MKWLEIIWISKNAEMSIFILRIWRWGTPCFFVHTEKCLRHPDVIKSQFTFWGSRSGCLIFPRFLKNFQIVMSETRPSIEILCYTEGPPTEQYCLLRSRADELFLLQFSHALHLWGSFVIGQVYFHTIQPNLTPTGFGKIMCKKSASNCCRESLDKLNTC